MDLGYDFINSLGGNVENVDEGFKARLELTSRINYCLIENMVIKGTATSVPSKRLLTRNEYCTKQIFL